MLQKNLAKGDKVYNKEDLFTKSNALIPEGTEFMVLDVVGDHYVIDSREANSYNIINNNSSAYYQTD